MTKARLSVYLDRHIMDALTHYAGKRQVSMSLVAEAALASFLSPDADSQREAAIIKRLDRIDRRIDRVERDQTIGIETLALFIRFWLSNTPQLPGEVRAATRAQGSERYDGFVEALGRRLARGSRLRLEISEDVEPSVPSMQTGGTDSAGAADRGELRSSNGD